MPKPKNGVLFAALAALSILAAACSSGSPGAHSSSSDANAGGTVSVNVGTGTPIHLKSGKLKVALFMHAQTNRWQQEIAAGAKAQANKYGWNFTLFQANYDLQTQINQLQQAAITKQFDAIAVVPVDPSAECNVITKTLPSANILVDNAAGALCNRYFDTGTGVWSPGEYSQDDVADTYDGYTVWLDATAKAFTGPQNVLFVSGPENNTGTAMNRRIMLNLVKEHPNLHLAGWLYTDWTTANTQAQVTTFLQGHPNITAIINAYSPDLFLGVVGGLRAVNMLNKVHISDFGGAAVTIPYMKDGLVKLTMPYYPYSMGVNLMKSFKDAQAAQAPNRIPSEMPGGATFSAGDIITAENVSSYKPQY